jgi:hypothetical protein
VAKLRPEERLAVACIQASLPGTTVVQHDRNSGRRVYDLALTRDGSVFGAVEVTAAADPDSIALWNTVHRHEGPWIDQSLVGGWMLWLYPYARVKDLRRELPALLAELERIGITEFGSDWRHRHDPYHLPAKRLGIAVAHQSATSVPGRIYFSIKLPIERMAGFVARTGDVLAEWVSEWVVRPDQADNLQKLRESGLAERHLFVVMPGFTTAPFSVVDLLTRDNAPLPTVPPKLPAEVTHLWILSLWNVGDGFRWSPDGGWSRFDKQFDLTDKLSPN